MAAWTDTVDPVSRRIVIRGGAAMAFSLLCQCSQPNDPRRQDRKTANRKYPSLAEVGVRNSSGLIDQREFFADGAPGDQMLQAAGAILRMPAGRAYPDAIPARLSGNSYSFGAGWRSKVADASFMYTYDGHDARGRWVGAFADEAIEGEIWYPTSRLSLTCPAGQGLLTEERRTKIARLLGSSPTVKDVEFVSDDYREIFRRVWDQSGL